FLEHRRYGGARYFDVVAVVPFDREVGERGLRLVERVADHRDTVVADLNDAFDARLAGDLAGIKAFDLAAPNRAFLDRRHHHGWKLDVEAVELRAVGLGQRVESFQRFARNRPILRIFERDVLGRLELAGGVRDLTVGRRAPARLVGNDAVCCGALGCWHVPGV